VRTAAAGESVDPQLTHSIGMLNATQINSEQPPQPPRRWRTNIL